MAPEQFRDAKAVEGMLAVYASVLDAPTGLCCGCGRTRDEIAVWGSLSEAQRRTLMAGLEARMRRAGLMPLEEPLPS